MTSSLCRTSLRYHSPNKLSPKCANIPLINFQNKESNILPIIQNSLNDTGFIYLRNTSITSQHINKILNVSRSFFFDCDSKIKDSINAYDTAFRGYYLYETSSLNDKIECFSIGKELKDPSVLRRKYFEQQGLPESIWSDYISRQNQWPIQYQKCDEFKSVLLEYYELCCKTSLQMLSLIAKSLDIDSQFFHKFHDLFDCTLEIKYYPPYSNQNDTTRLKEHADQTSITLLIQDVEDGLQIWDKNDLCYVDAMNSNIMNNNTRNNNNEDMILCNTGNFMQLWTNNKYKSTLHRVIGQNKDKTKGNMDNQGRVSVVFFCFPNHDAVIETVESCIDFEGQGHTKTVCGDELPFVF